LVILQGGQSFHQPGKPAVCDKESWNKEVRRAESRQRDLGKEGNRKGEEGEGERVDEREEQHRR